MGLKKAGRINYIRRTLQWIILILLVYMLVRPLFDKNYLADFEAYCPFGGIQALMSYLYSGSLACSMTTVQIGLGLALFIAVILFAKLFCSNICPVGTITEWFGSLGRKVKVHITVKGLADRILRIFKYALLFITVYFSVTSSELFCKSFDPYFALVSGFGSDVVIRYAIPALLLVVAGSFFIRQFWCKYICPLGAVTNIAVYALPAAALVLLWVILNVIFGGAIHWIWLLGGICLTGFLLEAVTLRFLVFPPLRIVRDAEKCTRCKICNKNCPMGISISEAEKVQHIDCHLCTDCIAKCPVQGALSINKKWPRWIPAVMTVLMIAAALVISNRFEIPTINEKWGSEEQMKSASAFEMEGLESIKCFGSSRAFANQMKEVPGVLGVSAFVRHHRVKVFYDKSVISEEGIKEAIFSPVSEFFLLPSIGQRSVGSFSVGINHCFDPNDQYYLTELLRQQDGILALQTHFGEPVKATVYYDDKVTDERKIIKAIQQKELVIGEGKDKVVQRLNFEPVIMKGIKPDTLPVSAFLRLFYEETDVTFNFFEKYKAGQIGQWEAAFDQATDPASQEWIPYLISHASNDSGIVRFSILFTDDGPVLRIGYVKSLTTPEKISKLLNAPELLVYYPDGKTEKVQNPFRI